MGEKKWYQLILDKWFWIDLLWSCKLFGHRFKFDPMPEDLPPFEFENCSICGEFNSQTYNQKP